MTSPSIARIWLWIYAGAVEAGSSEPKDVAQEVICRCLASGRDPTTLVTHKPSIFWRVAGKREAISQWRKRSGYGQDVTVVSYEPWHMPRITPDVEEAVLNHLALTIIPSWVKDVAGRNGNGSTEKQTGAERVALHRWRKSPLARKALAYLRATQ